MNDADPQRSLSPELNVLPAPENVAGLQHPNGSDTTMLTKSRPQHALAMSAWHDLTRPLSVTTLVPRSLATSRFSDEYRRTP